MKSIFSALFAPLLIVAVCVSCGDADKFFTDQTRDTDSEFDLPIINLSLYSTTVEYEGDSIVVEDGATAPDLTAGYVDTYAALNSTWLKIETATAVSNSAFDLKDSDSRLVITDMSYEEWSVSDLKNNIYVNGVVGLEDYNIEVRAYYNHGIAVKVIDDYFSPIVLYAGETTGGVEVSTIYTGSDVPLSSSVDKILVKRGYQVVVAASDDGTVSSVCYIAVDNDVEIELDATLKGQVKFLRALAIDYVDKRGVGGKSYASYVPPLNLNWFYTWGANTNTNTIIDIDPYTNYMPMFWSCPSDAGIQAVIDMQCPIVLFLNEPDNSSQSNVDVDKAIEYYKKIHAMGVRLVTPSCCELQNWDQSNPTSTTAIWVRSFMDGIIEAGLRYDGVGMHWYSYTQTTYTESNVGSTGWSKLNTSLTSCYTKYGKPIFLTEFNVEGSNATEDMTKTFLEYAMPQMEAAEYVERYALYPPGASVSWLFDTVDGVMTLNEYGEMYCNDIPSTPSIVMAASDNK